MLVLSLRRNSRFRVWTLNYSVVSDQKESSYPCHTFKCQDTISAQRMKAASFGSFLGGFGFRQQPDFDRRYDSRVRHKYYTCSTRSTLLYSSVLNSTLELLRSIPQYSGKTPCYSKVLQILRSTPNTTKYSWKRQ